MMSENNNVPKIRRLLVTGASGGMATALRPLLAKIAEKVVLSSRRSIEDLGPNEEGRPADLSNAEQARAIVKGCDAILHLGGYSVEGPFRPIMEANILGLYNLYEAARAEGQPRIIFASSNHVIGYYPQDVRLNADSQPRPDSLYGVSKCFGEALARFYYEKFGQETAIVRIGSCYEKPNNHRMLSTWMSFADFTSLVERVLTVPRLGCPIIYGASDNDRSWWDNSQVAYLGWKPADNSEAFAAEVDAAEPNPDPNSSVNRFQGGAFVDCPLMQEDADN